MEEQGMYTEQGIYIDKKMYIDKENSHAIAIDEDNEIAFDYDYDPIFQYIREGTEGILKGLIADQFDKACKELGVDLADYGVERIEDEELCSLELN